MIDLNTLTSLLVSFLLGGAVGWLREREGKTAGLRTHILVCIGSALFTLISSEMAAKSGAADPARIASGVVTGIGFIGAGCIIQAQGSIHGITTAAAIWVTAAIGVACGINYYSGAVVTTIITLITLELLREVEMKVIKTKEDES